MTAMKLTTGILATAMMVGGIVATSVAQNPDAIDNARSIAKSLQQKQANDTNAALDAAGVPASAKPAPGAPAPAVKPATIPGAKSAPAAPAQAPAPKTVAASASHNQLQKVNVAQGADGIQIEINTSEAVTPRVSKLKSPARVVVELPETVVAGAQTKIPVGSDGVKGVRIGMDGKTPPTTSVVVDLEKALSYDLAPGPAGKVVLILHTQDAGTTVAKNAPAPLTKAPTAASAASAKPAATAKVAEGKATAAKPVAAVAATNTPAAKPTKADSKQQAKTVVAAKASPVAVAMPAVTAKPAAAPKPKEEKKWAMTGKRDPFFSPVVQEHGSGCSTGK